MKKKIPLLFIIVFFSTFFVGTGQQGSENLDTQDSIRVEELYALAKEKSDRQPSEAKKYLYQIVQYIDSLVTSRKSKNNYFNKRKADAYHFLSYYERREHNFDEAAILAQKSIDIKLAHGLDSLLATSYHQKAKAWISVLNSMEDGIKQLKKAEQVAKKYKQTGQLLEIYSSLGSAYGVTNDTVNSMKYYNKSIHFVDSIGTDYQKAAMYANYAAILRRYKDYKSSLGYLQKAIVLHKKSNNKIGLESGLYALGVHYSDVGQPEKGITYLKQAIDLCVELKSEAVIPFRYLKLSRSYEAIGNYKESLEAYLKYHKLLEERNDVEEAKKLAKLETVFAYEKQKVRDSLGFAKEKSELKLITEAESAKKRLYFILFIITVLAGITIGYLIRRIYKNRVLKAKEELEKNKKELEDFTAQLVAKSKEQEALHKELEQLKTEVGEKESIQNLQHLATSKILTKDDWYTFKEKFIIAYPSFFSNIKNKGYELTQSEERLVAMEKLNLDTGQIANMLAISQDSVMMNRYRLRKKINAPKGAPILEYLEV
ncbi:hypothetical protein [Aquimarina sp. MMG016]|uniref:tetratricopeptide repeat protein n=1 Tax=Aquimarina sp. MMG016 TaxID=2822690 RepID=UPI001B3A459F|nr:hypothetical protein [Aquimarina sp. MMG016]MBQ4820620.1 hypothetical protein [Aquimarina sp. MMG016]